MNLAAYDIVKSKTSIKTWIDTINMYLNSIEIPFYTYYYIAKRYSAAYNCYSYYIILTNEKVDDPVPRCVYSPKKGLIKISLRDIWAKTKLKYVENNSEINIKLIDKQSDCIIYELDI